jgi:transposase
VLRSFCTWYCARQSKVFDPSRIQHVYIACGYTDLRRGVDGLVSIIQKGFQLDPFANVLFLFCGRRADRFMALYRDSDEFILLYKRLERGKYQWPRSKEEMLSLGPQQFRWLLEGLSIHQPKAHKPVTNIVYS